MVSRQHVVSRCVLRQWADGSFVGTFNLPQRRWTHGALKTQGSRRDFVPIDSEETEERWQQIENAAGPLLKYCGSQKSKFDAAEQRTLIELIALHYVRSDMVKRSYLTSYQRVMTGDQTDLNRTEIRQVEQYLNTRSSRTYPVGSHESERRARLWFANALRTGYRWEGRFGRMLIDQLDRVISFLSPLKLSVLNTKNPSDEFIISDAPVIAIVDASQQLVGRLGPRTMVSMPIGPHAAVWAGPDNGRWLLDSDQVERWNRWQLAGAQQRVYARSTAAKHFVESATRSNAE